MGSLPLSAYFILSPFFLRHLLTKTKFCATSYKVAFKITWQFMTTHHSCAQNGLDKVLLITMQICRMQLLKVEGGCSSGSTTCWIMLIVQRYCITHVIILFVRNNGTNSSSNDCEDENATKLRCAQGSKTLTTLKKDVLGGKMRSKE